jgi:hypothetical protein
VDEGFPAALDSVDDLPVHRPLGREHLSRLFLIDVLPLDLLEREIEDLPGPDREDLLHRLGDASYLLDEQAPRPALQGVLQGVVVRLELLDIGPGVFVEAGLDVREPSECCISSSICRSLSRRSAAMLQAPR